MRSSVVCFAVCTMVLGQLLSPSYAATKDVFLGSDLSGGVFAKYSSDLDALVFASDGWGDFEQMISLENGDASVVAGVTAGGGSLLFFDNFTRQVTTGWGSWQGLAELGNGKIVHSATLSAGSYSVQNGDAPYGWSGFGFSTGWGTVEKLTSLSNGEVVSGSSNLG
ncbi:MAG: hypothetical protein MI725_02095, partial [Pirellulales bacterium]|nr:hypothetical protein [Pirellulales bacterium]